MKFLRKYCWASPLSSKFEGANSELVPSYVPILPGDTPFLPPFALVLKAVRRLVTPPTPIAWLMT